MKTLTYILILLSLISISCKHDMINKDSIYIKKINLHPFLKDHERRLLIKLDNTFVDSVDLYSDPGEGCNSYLCEKNHSFILIDCNGDWFSINKKSGKIEYIGWKWKADYPDRFVGAFSTDENSIYYKIDKRKVELYKFKDPIR